MRPDWESNRQHFGLQACTQSTELHQLGQTFCYVTVLHMLWQQKSMMTWIAIQYNFLSSYSPPYNAKILGFCYGHNSLLDSHFGTTQDSIDYVLLTSNLTFLVATQWQSCPSHTTCTVWSAVQQRLHRETFFHGCWKENKADCTVGLKASIPKYPSHFHASHVGMPN